MAENIKLAERVKNYRERLGLSVEELAQKSGVALRTITDLEAGISYPALGAMVKLSRALGQRLGTFTDDQFSADPVIVRATGRVGESATHNSAQSGGFTYFPLGKDKPDRHMEPFFIEIEGDAEAEFSSHEGEELIFVLEGSVRLDYGKESFVLNQGDSMYYNSVVSHRVNTADGKPAKIHAVVFMPF